MHLYTLIAYKPDSTDTCMGCLMANYSSDFEGFTSPDASAIARRWAKLLKRNEALEHGESGFDISLLIDGIPRHYDDIEMEWSEELEERQNALKPEFARIQELAEAELKAMHDDEAAKAQEAARLKAEAEEVARRRDSEEQEARERAEFERLSAKFGKGGARA